MARDSPLALRFVTSAPSLDRLPPSPAEIAIVGRSNVGKSSLLNALAHQRHLAQVSRTPGRTQLLNLFEERSGPTVVDLPGYGYAKVPERVRARWAPMIETYLLGREALVMVVTLVDGAVGPTRLDLQNLEWLAHHGLPHQVVATKADRVKAAQRVRRQREVAAACGLEPDDVLWVSASTGEGLDLLRRRIREWWEADL